VTALHLRWLIRRDMPEVLAIEAASFGAHAWTEEEFVRAIRQRSNIALVAELGETIVGYTVYELRKASIQVLNFAVHPDYRRRGVGTALFSKLVTKLTPGHNKRHKLTLEVRETNLPAQQFFRARGMKAISVLRDFYEAGPGDVHEDAYLMLYKLSYPAMAE
jgi:ribosomal-protein-alanine N-acetyltransferase